MQKIIIKRICSVVILALLSILILNFALQTRNAQRRMIENAEIKLEQVIQTIQMNEIELKELSASLDEDYLTRAHAFAFVIEQNPAILESSEELEKVKELLNVDELHVIDENGILFAGTVQKYFGMDFRSTKQTEEFLSILDGKTDFLIQNIQPNGAEQKLFQYIGVKRQDKPGIVQIGIAPKRILEAQKRNHLSYLFSRIPMDSGSVLFAADLESRMVIAHSNSDWMNRSAEEMGADLEQLRKFQDGGFYTLNGVKKFYVTREFHNLLLGIGQKESDLYGERKKEMGFIFFSTLLLFFIVVFNINHLLKKQIIDGIYKILDGLSEITNGNLDAVVQVGHNPEFQKLSTGINQMVTSILESSVKVARIIDMTGLPIGVFEFNHKMERVLATDGLYSVLNWTEEFAEACFLNKTLFLNELEKIRKNTYSEEEEAYQIAKAPEKWVKIHMIANEKGTFGVVSDITEEILKKRELERERDYDSLTGLCNMNKFKRQVERLLKKGFLENAAMIMMDLDYFKNMNDQFGHDWGDQYLQITADFLKKFQNGNGIAARRSGDEFCLFLFHFQSKEEIRNLIFDFYQNLSVSKVKFPDDTFRILQISTGIAWYNRELNTFEALLKAADCALYDSKKDGRGRFKEYHFPGIDR